MNDLEPEDEDKELDREAQKNRRKQKFAQGPKAPKPKPSIDRDEIAEEGRRAPRRNFRWEDFDEDDDGWFGK